MKKGWMAVGMTCLILSLTACGSGSGKNAETENSSETAAVTEAEKIFYIDLCHNYKDYTGKYVEVTVPVSYISSDGTVTVDSDYLSDSFSIETNDKSLEDKEDEITYLAARGKVADNDYKLVLTDCQVLYTGRTAPDGYDESMSDYLSMVAWGKVVERQQFIDSAQEVSYEELRRNPDTYQDQPLKLTVSITEVEADGWIFPGDVWASYQGGETSVIDDRENREPRLMAGDSLVIYARGNGLATVKTYAEGTGILGSNIGADVLDEREIVQVTMLYTDLEDTSKYAAGTTDEYSYYLLGIQNVNTDAAS